MSEQAYEDAEPTAIERNSQQRVVRITWSDGHQSTYDYEFLRWRCPCATCAGEGGHQGMLETITELKPEQTELVEIRLVGWYGMSPAWRDGHDTGIYTFSRLREICPCAECRDKPF